MKVHIFMWDWTGLLPDRLILSRDCLWFDCAPIFDYPERLRSDADEMWDCHWQTKEFSCRWGAAMVIRCSSFAENQNVSDVVGFQKIQCICRSQNNDDTTGMTGNNFSWNLPVTWCGTGCHEPPPSIIHLLLSSSSTTETFSRYINA